MATTREIVDHLLGMLGSFDGVQWTQAGVPEKVPAKVGAYVTVGGQVSPRRTTGTVRRERRFRVTIAYALDDAEGAAELAVADIVDALTETILADPTLGGRVGDVEIDATAADTPRYADRPEWIREYPVVLITSARERGRVHAV